MFLVLSFAFDILLSIYYFLPIAYYYQTTLVTLSNKLCFVFDAGRIHIIDGVVGLSF